MPEENNNANAGGANAGTENEGGQQNEGGNEGQNASSRDNNNNSNENGFEHDNLPRTQADLDKLIDKRLERQKKQFEADAKLSDDEKKERELAEAKAKNAEADLRHEFVMKSGLDYQAGSRMFELYKSEIETDDKGKGTNFSDVIKKAQKEFPEKFPKKLEGNGDGGKGGKGGKSGEGNANMSMNEKIRSKSGFSS